ncbi:hypothetical protein BH24BAC1_BH24BAC1_04070 [soil metagenome]
MNAYPTLKKIFVLILLFLGIAFASIFAFTLYYENKFPDQVKEYFSNNSEQVLQDFQTGVALSRHFPFFALRVRNFEVLDTTGGRSLPVLRVEKADFHLHFAALLRGRLGIRRTTLSGLVFRQQIDSLGRTTSFQLKNAEQPVSSSPQPTGFEISGIDIRQATILIQNDYKKSGSSVVIERARLAVDFAADTFTVGGTVTGHTQYIANRKRTMFRDEPFTGRLNYAYAPVSRTGLFTNTIVEINGLPIRIDGTHAKREGEPGTEMNLVLKGSQPLREVLHDLVPDSLQKFFAEAKSAGTLDFTYALQGVSSPTIRPRSQVDFSLANGALEWPERQARLENISLAGTLDNGEESGPASSTLTISQVSAGTGTGGFSGSLRLHNFLQPKVAGKLTCETGLRELAAVLDLPNYSTYSGQIKLDITAEETSGARGNNQTGPQMAWQGSLQVREGAFQPQNTSVLCSELNADAAFGEQAVHLKQLAGKVDGHSFTMQASFPNLLSYLFAEASVLQVKGAVQARQLDLAWLTEPKMATRKPKEKGESKLLASTSGNLTLDIQKVRLTPKDDLANLRVDLRKNKNKVELKEIRFGAPMGGTGQGDGGLMLVKGAVKAPFLNMNLRFGELDLQHLMGLIAEVGVTSKQIAVANQGPSAAQAAPPLEDFRVVLRVNSEKLKYESLTGTQLNLMASLTHDKAQIQQFDLHAFGGRFASSGFMDLTQAEGFPVQLYAQLNKMDLYRMFHVADQLKLDVLKSQNIRGNIDCVLDLRTRLDQTFLTNVPNTTAFAKAVIRNLELIEVEPIQKALHFLREKRTRHIHFEDVHTQFLLHQNRFLSPGINLTNNISYFYLSGSYAMEASAELFVEVSLFDVLFGNNERRIRRIKEDPTRSTEKQVKQHLLLHREKQSFQVKVAQRKNNEEAQQELRAEFHKLLLQQKIDTSFKPLPTGATAYSQ